jgi:hypothetical protein
MSIRVEIVNASSLDRGKIGRLANLITAVVERDEKDPKILENMVGDVPWSLTCQLFGYRKFGEETASKGRLFLLYDEDKLVGLSGTELDVDDRIRLTSNAHLGVRLWIDLFYRNQYLPTKLIAAQLEWATLRRAAYVWTSFNEDRKGLIRRMAILRQNPDPDISSVWEGWSVNEHPTMVNHVLQTVATKALKVEDSTSSPSSASPRMGFQTHR